MLRKKPVLNLKKPELMEYADPHNFSAGFLKVTNGNDR